MKQKDKKELLEKATLEIKNPMKSWWAGDPRVAPYMPKVKQAIDRHVTERDASTDIYNRAYEAVYQAIRDFADGDNK